MATIEQDSYCFLGEGYEEPYEDYLLFGYVITYTGFWVWGRLVILSPALSRVSTISTERNSAYRHIQRRCIKAIVSSLRSDDCNLYI